jgi:hypothetical protein
MIRWQRLIAVAVMMAVTWGSNSVLAAPALQGVSVSPAFQQVDMKAGSDDVQFDLELTNYTSVGQNFTLSTTDFGSLNEQGGIAFQGQLAKSVTDKYGLAAWMSLEKDQLFLAPGTSEKVEVTVHNRDSLAPGGHYGAVLATAQTDGNPGSSQVGVKQVISSLVLLSKQGGGAPDLNLVEQAGNGHAWSLPTKVEHRFQNAGNIHVVPRGVTEVRDPMNHLMARGALNENSGIILPESFRRYDTSLVAVAKAWLPGRYEIRTAYRYDGTSQTKVAVSHIWFAGLVVVWLVGLGALIAIGLLGWWLWRRYR